MGARTPSALAYRPISFYFVFTYTFENPIGLHSGQHFVINDIWGT